MRAVIQRCGPTTLTVDGKVISHIESGLTVFLAIAKGDTEEQADYFARKLTLLRIFADENDKMNLSVKDVGKEILLVSQFCLAGTLGKRSGNRPDFKDAELPDRAKYLYERVRDDIIKEGVPCQTGMFGEHMVIDQKQLGPLTFVFEC